MDLELRGRHALVTGGTRGIGLAIGSALAREGASVMLVGRNHEELVKRAQALESATGSTVRSYSVDVTDAPAVEEMFKKFQADLFATEILVNAAATPSAYPGLTDVDLEHEIDVKVRGYLRMVRGCESKMIENNWGRIINIGGVRARETGSLVGSVRNASVIAMTKNLADELGSHGINITSLHPGWTRTERTNDTLSAIAKATGRSSAEVETSRIAAISIGRMVTAEEIADVAVFLASPKSVAINGDAIYAGGGVKGHIYY
jgi:NAD(P)-dependent dehydrogenase (short-subunit alcohol dehydrogenase family)